MFTVESLNENSGLEQAIDKVLRDMTSHPSDSEEFAQMVKQLSKLYSLKEVDSKKRVSPDTLALVAGNLLGIILIVGHERMNVVTSKALNFVMKLR